MYWQGLPACDASVKAWPHLFFGCIWKAHYEEESVIGLLLNFVEL
jgi:hypothetical protein